MILNGNFECRLTSSLRSSRPPATRLRPTGPLSSPRPSRVRMLRSSSPTSAPPPLPLLPPLVVLPLLLVPPLPPPRRRRRRRRKRPTSIWAASSETTTERFLQECTRWGSKAHQCARLEWCPRGSVTCRESVEAKSRCFANLSI